MKPFRLRIENIQFSPNVPAGCNFLVIASLILLLRGTTDDPPPVVVREEGNGRYSITDGRHRTIAAIIAGRPDVLCVLESGGSGQVAQGE